MVAEDASDPDAATADESSRHGRPVAAARRPHRGDRPRTQASNPPEPAESGARAPA